MITYATIGFVDHLVPSIGVARSHLEPSFVNTQHHLFTTENVIIDVTIGFLPHSTMVTIGFRLFSSLANDACHL